MPFYYEWKVRRKKIKYGAAGGWKKQTMVCLFCSEVQFYITQDYM